jgi:2-oxoglutarate dehydrogenase E2 component (dihydrolipoamide succinyltransferase)
MSNNVTLPALGESVTEGTVTRWLKKVGDTVAVDEALVEVSTDKVDTEIPSPFAGVLEQILVQEDETVQVGGVLAVIGSLTAGAAGAEPAAEAPTSVVTPPVVTPPVVTPPVVTPPVAEAPAPISEVEAPLAAAATPAATIAEPTPVASIPVAEAVSPVVTPIATVAPPVNNVVPTAVASSDATYVTPLVRKLASETGVDLSMIAGTGVGGRIRKDDVIASASAPASTPVASVAASAVTQASTLRGTTEPMSRLRKVLAERAVASMQQTAQLTTVVEVDVTKVAQMRQLVQPAFVAATGGKLNFMPFFALAAAEALRTNPKLNASIDGDNIVFHPTENIAFAVDTERGLLTPVIRDTASLTIAQIAVAIADLASRTRENKLKPDELGGATFTLTNTGSRGALFDTPVVFLPQVAILGTGIVTKRPVVVTGADGSEGIAIRSMVYLALSYDHRLVDGADASRYLVDVKTRLEQADFEPNLGI